MLFGILKCFQGGPTLFKASNSFWRVICTEYLVKPKYFVATEVHIQQNFKFQASAILLVSTGVNMNIHHP